MINKAVYCKNCGFVSTECEAQKGICPVCKSKLFKTQEGAGYFVGRTEKTMPTWEDVVRHRYLKNIALDTEKSAKRSKIEQNKQQEELRKLKNNSSKNEGKNFKPKCPTCGSTNVKLIGSGERTLSIITLGLLSKKINKSFKCLDCKYTW